MLSTKCVEKSIYLIHMYKKDMALNNLQWLICQKRPKQSKPNNSII